MNRPFPPVTVSLMLVEEMIMVRVLCAYCCLLDESRLKRRNRRRKREGMVGCDDDGCDGEGLMMMMVMITAGQASERERAKKRGRENSCCG